MKFSLALALAATASTISAVSISPGNYYSMGPAPPQARGLPNPVDFGKDYSSQNPTDLQAWAERTLEAVSMNYEKWLMLWGSAAPHGVMIPDLMGIFSDFNGQFKQDSYKGRIGNAMAQSVYNMARVQSGY
ncbi:hypothetical protein AAP_04283 [Ascosphaera apis ARSEF 7405]|uniref:Uncharacterized protein n=1 Tax=Ascosphaera apis ARSEF 7405 TaxID=392613 RepID=A0A167X1T4_9EURO|nr:hypothetical protein AAP_04283 [Ascosphaera apis ARSEF 7405]